MCLSCHQTVFFCNRWTLLPCLKTLRRNAYMSLCLLVQEIMGCLVLPLLEAGRLQKMLVILSKSVTSTTPFTRGGEETSLLKFCGRISFSPSLSICLTRQGGAVPIWSFLWQLNHSCHSHWIFNYPGQFWGERASNHYNSHWDHVIHPHLSLILPSSLLQLLFK